MSDDGFFREVEEELRSERLKNFWERFGVLIVAGAVLIVVLIVALLAESADEADIAEGARP